MTAAGRVVVADTPHGLFVRSSPGGDVVQLDGRPLVRKQGFRIAVAAREYAAGRWWVCGGRYWYAEEYTRPYDHGPSGDYHVESPVPGYRVTTPYGRRKPGLWRTKGYHTGDDYSAPRGADVVAVLDGYVVYRTHPLLGKVLLLFASDGRTKWYGNLSNRIVPDGTGVTAGQRIGNVGRAITGVRGTHLHFEDHRGHSDQWWSEDRKPAW